MIPIRILTKEVMPQYELERRARAYTAGEKALTSVWYPIRNEARMCSR